MLDIKALQIRNNFIAYFGEKPFSRICFKLVDGRGNISFFYVGIGLEFDKTGNVFLYTAKPIKASDRGFPLYPYKEGLSKEDEPRMRKQIDSMMLGNIIHSYETMNNDLVLGAICSCMLNECDFIHIAYAKWISNGYNRIMVGPVLELLQ